MTGESHFRRRAVRPGAARIHGAWMAVAGLTALTASCGGSEGLASYMAKNSGVVVLIQWQVTSPGQLRGTFTAAQASGTPPTMRVASSSTPFTGTISGRNVTLDFRPRLRFFSGPVGPSSLARISGTVDSGALGLRVPDSVRDIVFTQADVSAYNTALARLRHRVERANIAARAFYDPPGSTPLVRDTGALLHGMPARHARSPAL
jgi:hypothetical protein